MKDLRNRMRIFDEVPAPSYWKEIEMRASSAPEATAPARGMRPTLLLVAALLLTAAIGGALVLSGNLELPDSSAPRLAYALDGDVYLADQDGGNAVRLADGVPPDGLSAQCGTFTGEGTLWALDGSHFAYRSWSDTDAGCPGEVHVRDAEGHLVASVPGFGWDIGWSPDSTRFATWIEFGETIGIYGLDGERQALLTSTPECEGSGDYDPVWSPDGESVVVGHGSCEFPVDGSAPRHLPETDPRTQIEWTYSPDGTMVAYVAAEITDDGQAFDRSLVIAESSGTVIQVVHEEPIPYYSHLLWSPSGDRVLFTQTPFSDAGYPSADSQLRQVDVGTGDVSTLAAEPGVSPIRFSPEGDRILVSTWDADDTTGLWSIDADGSDMQLVVSGTYFGDWQPLPASPSAEPSGSAAPSVAPSAEPSTTAWTGLPEGPHAVTESTFLGMDSVAMTVSIAAPGWSGDVGAGGMEKGRYGFDLPDGAGMIVFPGVDEEYFVYGDPCAWSTTRPAAPATTVDALMGALAAQASRDATTPVDITVGGYAGKAITLHVPDDADFAACDEGAFASWGVAGEDLGLYAQGPGEIDEVWILDVDGRIVVIEWGHFADTPQAVVGELEALVESSTFE